ncbi:MAG TPA: formate/nitrite transporter family protein [Clostridia bacterium]|jgi:formate/nitrite transporter FocA (FNT family)|nr:formate/nitrite transporter family protein [Clostridia bacterium]
MENNKAKLTLNKDIKMWLKLVVSGMMAGISISIGGLAFILMKSSGANQLYASLLFPIGIFLTCYFGLDLYTGKIGYLIENFNKEYVLKIIVITISNLIGTIIFGYLMLFMFKGKDLSALQTIGEARVLTNSFKSFAKVFISSMFGCAFVHISVELFKRLKSDFGKIVALWLPVTAFVYFGFDHSIANMFYFSFLDDLSGMRWLYILVNIVGNAAGGILTHLLILFVSPRKKEEVAVQKNPDKDISDKQ